jgi:3'-5' exoribonuclease
MLRKEILKIKDFPIEYSKKLEHITLSHQGRYEWKSLKLPSFPEALLIHLIGFSDSRMNLMDLAIKNDKEHGAFTNKFNYFGIPILKDSETK